MGRDKALLPHPEGGSWLERTLRLLQELQVPVTLFSRHASHLRLAQQLNSEPRGQPTALPPLGPPPAPGEPEARPGPAPAATCHRVAGGEARTAAITALVEPPPWEGPLLALQRLMQRHPEERLLLCPVDMPDLSLAALKALLAAAADRPADRIHLAHDGARLQPLLGIYPSVEPLRSELTAAVQRGERRLQSWLATQQVQAVQLDPTAIRNVNHPQEELPAPPDTQNAQKPLTRPRG